MPRLIWSPDALQGVSRLYRLLAPKNRNAAKRAVSAIREGVKPLRQHPEVGRPVDDMPVEFREWPIGSALAAMLRSTGSTAKR
jgi:plasmid stabilization system protein ParE